MRELTRRDVLRYGGFAAAGLGLGGAMAACGGDTSGEEYDLITTMKDRGHAVLGIVDSPPGSMVRDGKLEGSNVEIVTSILKKHGITKFKPFLADFPGMVSGLLANRMDICVAGLLITDERCDAIAFSVPVNVLIYSMAVKAGNPKSILSIKDVAKADAKLAVESATTQERVAKEILPDGKIVRVAGRRDGVDAVRVGRADAYLAPVDEVERVLANQKQLEVTPTVPDMPKIGSGITFRKADSSFVSAFNKGFAELRKSGEYARIMKKYDQDPKRIEMKDIRKKC